MAGLYVGVSAGQNMIVNGAAIHFLSSSELKMMNKVRFVYGRQIMFDSDATTPARIIYFNIQNAYIGDPLERGPAMSQAREHIQAFWESTNSDEIRDLLDCLWTSALNGRLYDAMKAARRLSSYEDAILGLVPFTG